MAPVRGRGKPAKVDKELLKSLILENKSSIISKNNVIASAQNEVWTQISSQLEISASTIHSYVLNNRHGLKDDLIGKKREENNSGDEKCYETETDQSSVNNSTDEEKNDAMIHFSFGIKKATFNDMIVETTTFKKKKKAKN